MSFISFLQTAPRPEDWRDLIDIALVTYLMYLVARLIRGTRAWRVLQGILAFAAVLWLAHWLRLRALSFLLDRAATIGPVALLVVFLPEVRQWVMELGTGSFWRGPFTSSSPEIRAMIDEVVAAVEHMAQRRTGALLVLEGRVGLDDIAGTGRRMDSIVSTELVETIFFPGSALHDGAAVFRDQRLVAAGCILPMPPISPRSSSRTAHTRHASALELAQQTDAFIIVVSEETGSISVAHNRSLIKGLTGVQLRERLMIRYGASDSSARFHLFGR